MVAVVAQLVPEEVARAIAWAAAAAAARVVLERLFLSVRLCPRRECMRVQAAGLLWPGATVAVMLRLRHMFACPIRRLEVSALPVIHPVKDNLHDDADKYCDKNRDRVTL